MRGGGVFVDFAGVCEGFVENAGVFLWKNERFPRKIGVFVDL